MQRIITLLAALFSFAICFGQDSSAKAAKGNGEIAGSWLWITIIIIAVLFGIFAIGRSRRARQDVVKKENIPNRVIKDTKPDH